ncbi:MAG: WD40 repeat domain-containing protein [Gemmataceae bacterium]
MLAGLTTAVSTVHLWERTGKKLASVELDVQDAMFDFSPDATRLAVVGRTTDVSVLSLHNLPDGKELWRTDTDNAVSVVRFAEQGKMLYGGSWTGVIQTWDVASGAMTAPFGGHQGALNAVQLTSDNKFALTWSDDHSARWWNAGTGTELHRFPFPKQFQGSTVMLLDDHTVLAAGTVRDEDLEVTEGGVWIYDAESAQEKRKLTIPRLEVAMAQVSHDRRLLVLLDSVGCAHIHNLATGKELFVIQTGATREKKRLLRCGFSTDDRLLYLRECAPTGDSQVKPPLVRVIEMSTGKERRRFTLDDWAGGDEQVCLATPTGLVVDVWFGLLLLDPNTGLEVRRFSANSLRDSTASISSDGRYLAGGTRTGSIRFWDIATGTVLGELAGHRSAVTSLAFSEDGTRLISGSLDTTALIWDLREFLTRQPAPPRWNGAEQDRLWAELAHDDAAQADRAMQTLIRAGDKAVTLVRTRLGPAAFKADQASIDRLLEQLDSSDFKVRERADSELEELELAAEPALRRALASGSLSVETAQRVRRLLDGLDGRVRSPAQLRALRAIEVLEKIGTASAHNVLQILGKGSAEARQTQAARAAEQRLQKRNQSTPSP